MNIWTHGGLLPFETFEFPDGQQHFRLLHRNEFHTCTIETAITDSGDLFDVLLAKDVLSQQGYTVSLDIRYLLGARMDRRIDGRQPFTLAVVARMLLAAGFRKIRILDPHSEVSTKLLDAEPVYPLQTIKSIIEKCPSNVMIIAPDAGATPRVRRLLYELQLSDRLTVVQGLKHRDSNTGRLSGFGLVDGSSVNGRECLIVDDLCDGGGTFVGLAAVLREAGATKVFLYVTHGIFSKGGMLEGIDRVYTTDSYYRQSTNVICFDVLMRDI